MNPPTVGHEKLVGIMEQYDGDKIIHLSHTSSNKKNPLDYDYKLELAQIAFGDIVQESNNRTIIESLKELSGIYENIIMVVGSDRVDEFKELFEEYSESEFPFVSWEIVSAGDRTLTENYYSSTKLRAAFLLNDIETIQDILPESLHQYISDIQEQIVSCKSVNKTIEETQFLKRKQQFNRVKKILRTPVNK